MSQYESKLQSEEMDFLAEAFLSLETREECYRLFEDIATIAEIKAFEQRLQVARMLKHKKTYVDIANKTGVSTATISRVNRSLTYGSDGYNTVLERIDK